MNLEQRIKAFSKLGEILKPELFKLTNSNTWFTKENMEFAVSGILKFLNYDDLKNWTNQYIKLDTQRKVNNIGVILSGNIPFVGFHDFLCVLLSGNVFIGKLSSKDDILPQIIAKLLIEIEPKFESFVKFEEYRLTGFDAVIATGSNNSSRYFEYYFGKYPNIIRHNRNSVAVLTGNETETELELLSDDIFLYFGLGCRNVSKIFIPEDFDKAKIFEHCTKYKNLTMHHKYSNNYGYNRSIYLMNNVIFWDNGFMLLTESKSYSSPISVVYFEQYKDIEEVKQKIEADKNLIQCVVSQSGLIENSICFGNTQLPGLNDYADNIDTMEFLLSLK